MDFEWQSHAPADASSPFTKHTMSYHESQKNPQLKKRESYGQDRGRALETTVQSVLISYSIGAYGVFDSPAKPSTPSLREPASQPFLFSHTPSQKPASAFRNSSFTTPRKIDIDFSSGPDTPDNADNEDTPEPARSAAPKSSNAVTQFTGISRTDKKQHPLFAMYGKHAASPGRGEVPRGNVYSNGITKRVRRQRREREQRLMHRRPDQDSDSEERSRPSSSEGADATKGPPTREIGLIPSVLSFIDTHPNLPHVLSYYAQLLLNVFLVFFFIYIIYSFWSTIRSDVDKASEEVAAETLAEMAVCAREYVDNRCDRDSRVPAMERVCDNWEKCMNKDPTSVGRATVSAHTFAQIFNSFIEPISYKAMVRDFFPPPSVPNPAGQEIYMRDLVRLLPRPPSHMLTPPSPEPTDLLPNPPLRLRRRLQLRLLLLPQ